MDVWRQDDGKLRQTTSIIARLTAQLGCGFPVSASHPSHLSNCTFARCHTLDLFFL